MRMVGTGLAIGLAGAFAVTRLLSSQLFGVQPTDPATFIAVSVVLGVVALAAAWVPARRASRALAVSALTMDG
jgi:ABC-type antimicrobial peptide transport system permease subunit